ncbi:MAG: hypothetical protein WAT36_14860 [Chromatiaceae bacterium]
MPRPLATSPAEQTQTTLGEESLRLILQELQSARAETRHQSSRLRLMALGLGLMAILAGWSGYQAISSAERQAPVTAPATSMSPEARAAQRRELLAMLPEETRAELEKFAQQAEWLDQYMHTWEPDQAGALVSLMLFRMTKTMDTLPEMERNMRVMSGQMAALPAIVGELNQINAKMSVITGNLDSTMGRAGRMMPWMPFAP